MNGIQQCSAAWPVTCIRVWWRCTASKEVTLHVMLQVTTQCWQSKNTTLDKLTQFRRHTVVHRKQQLRKLNSNKYSDT